MRPAPAVAPPAVETAGLTRRFRRRFGHGATVTALEGLSVMISSGTFAALCGPNGAGKTTFLEILATLLLPTSGMVRVSGLDPVETPLAVRRLVGYCPGGSVSFWPRLTARENLSCFAALGGLALSGAALEARIDATLAQVGLRPDVAVREVRTYSDGEAQRLNLARLILRDASIWLLDEPTRSLDVAGQEAIWRLIRETAAERGVTVIAATHDMAGVSAVADRVVRLG